MTLRRALENSTHDYSGDGYMRVCANFCGAYFIIVRGSGLADDHVQAGCRVPDDVDIFGECPKAGRLKVETSYDGPGDRNRNALLILGGPGSDLEISISRPENSYSVNYYATPETAIDLLEWLARHLKAEIRWLPKGGRQEPAVPLPFATGSAAMLESTSPTQGEYEEASSVLRPGPHLGVHEGKHSRRPLKRHEPNNSSELCRMPVDHVCWERCDPKADEHYHTPTGAQSAGLAPPSAPEVRFTNSTHLYGGLHGECLNGCGAIYSPENQTGPTAFAPQGVDLLGKCPKAGQRKSSGNETGRATDAVSLPVKALVVLRAVAYGPTSGLDQRCAFCDAFQPEHVRVSQAGHLQDCPVIAARKILMARNEHWDLEGRI